MAAASLHLASAAPLASLWRRSRAPKAPPRKSGRRRLRRPSRREAVNRIGEGGLADERRLVSDPATGLLRGHSSESVRSFRPPPFAPRLTSPPPWSRSRPPFLPFWSGPSPLLLCSAPSKSPAEKEVSSQGETQRGTRRNVRDSIETSASLLGSLSSLACVSVCHPPVLLYMATAANDNWPYPMPSAVADWRTWRRLIFHRATRTGH